MMILKTGRINNKGITLVEVCLVGIILSLLFAVSWPALNKMARRAQLENICKEISYTLRYARDYALNENKYYSVEFDTDHRQYWLAAKNDGASDTEVFTPLNDSLHRTKRWTDEVIVDNFSSKNIIFYPDGTSRDFAVSLKNKYGDTYILKLQGSTGRITISI